MFFCEKCESFYPRSTYFGCGPKNRPKNAKIISRQKTCRLRKGGFYVCFAFLKKPKIWGICEKTPFSRSEVRLMHLNRPRKSAVFFAFFSIFLGRDQTQMHNGRTIFWVLVFFFSEGCFGGLKKDPVFLTFFSFFSAFQKTGPLSSFLRGTFCSIYDYKCKIPINRKFPEKMASRIVRSQKGLIKPFGCEWLCRGHFFAFFPNFDYFWVRFKPRGLFSVLERQKPRKPKKKWKVAWKHD